MAGRRGFLFLLLWLSALPSLAAPPSPETFFGHRMGADRRLVKWPQVVSYYQKLAAGSPAVKVEELGLSTEDRPFLLVTVSSPQNLARLTEFREIQRKLADPRLTTAAEAEELIDRGKAIVLVTCSIHSTEVASTLTAMEYVYKLVTEDTPRHRRILQDTIFLLVPSLNPDGVDKVADWYQHWVGTRYEGAPMVELYQRYVGHDNNRDWYIFSQQETRLLVEKAHNVWHPEIVYDVHQMGATGARIFVPPWLDPVDPNIDPLIVQQANSFGMQMATDLTSEGLKGVVVNGIYDYFSPARHYQSYHGGIRLLSESASARYATPVTVPFSSLQTRARGYNAQESSWNFLEPWQGGRWSLRDIVDYQLVAFESVLYNAALKRPQLLRNFYRIGQRAISRRSPAGVLLYRRQHDPNALTRLMQTLQFGMVEVQRASQDFFADGEQVHEGDYVISMNQPYSSFAETLLDSQDYPDLREYPGGPPRSPYDVTAHSLPLLMGVEVKMLGAGLADAPVSKVDQVENPPGRVAGSETLSLSPAYSNSWIAVNRLLAMNAAVYRDETNGRFIVRKTPALATVIERLARDLGVDFDVAPADLSAYRLLRSPRVGVYAGFVPIIDEGWTRWLLEQYEFQFARVDNARIAAGGSARGFRRHHLARHRAADAAFGIHRRRHLQRRQGSAGLHRGHRRRRRGGVAALRARGRHGARLQPSVVVRDRAPGRAGGEHPRRRGQQPLLRSGRSAEGRGGDEPPADIRHARRRSGLVRVRPGVSASSQSRRADSAGRAALPQPRRAGLGLAAWRGVHRQSRRGRRRPSRQGAHRAVRNPAAISCAVERHLQAGLQRPVLLARLAGG